ncbi:type I-E CRISPR-associated endoribonuclease Cas2e [Ornithinimicrobium cavernae]|uniref:type I-E CRISPR-associated endoribonuclease Cas2e n=1 Tax=Ornithinimicrobium cavernae TaxID=2666047 RepID=UPI001F022FBF|nr:type I-E CRISPR-associated endoribonuclease Cas2e [Ornithinimicrobium cavernae]
MLVLTACPAGLRGHLTRWLLEISAGVFVGRVSARVRAELWQRVTELAKDGRAVMVFQDDTEQGFSFQVNKHHWSVVDHDGLTLMLRPSAADSPEGHDAGAPRKGWSKASRRRRR